MGIVAGAALRITAAFRLSNAIAIENVYDMRCTLSTGAPDSDGMAVIGAGLEVAYSPLMARLSQDLVCTEIRGFNETADEPLPTIQWPTLTGGVNTSDNMPSGVAALVLFRTGKARVVGRKFIGGWNETENDDGSVLAASAAALAAYGAEVSDPANFHSASWDFTFVIVDKLGVPRAPEEIVVRGVWSYQRRRKLGVGI